MHVREYLWHESERRVSVRASYSRISASFECRQKNSGATTPESSNRITIQQQLNMPSVVSTSQRPENIPGILHPDPMRISQPQLFYIRVTVQHEQAEESYERQYYYCEELTLSPVSGKARVYEIGQATAILDAIRGNHSHYVPSGIFVSAEIVPFGEEVAA